MQRTNSIQITEGEKTSGKNSIQSKEFSLFILMIFLAAIWIAIQLIIVLLAEKTYMLIGTIIFFCVLFILVNKLIGSIKLNHCEILLDNITKGKRAVFAGSYIKLPWENTQKSIDLEASVKSDKVSETFPIIGGSIKVTFTILSKPNASGDNDVEKSENIVNFAKIEPEGIKSMQESAAKKTIREKVMNKPIATVRAMTGDALLNKNDLKKISKELSLQIIDCQVNDLDFSDKLQEAENAVGRATVLARMTKILVTDGGYDQKMAQEIAPFLLDNLKMDKQVKEYNFKGLTIPEEIITKIINLIKK